MGDVVNLASRLEGSNKLYGTTVIASEAAVTLTGAALVWRELDAIRVVGRTGAVNIYEPLAEAGEATAEQSARATAYAEGLARWRAADFAGAKQGFARFADSDPPSAAFLDRATKLAANPPGPGWQPVSTLEGK